VAFCFFNLFGQKKKPVADALILGIGNIGGQYSNTRHNIGFEIVDSLQSHYGKTAWQKYRDALVCVVDIAGKNVVLVKPITFVNRSGTALASCLSAYSVPVNLGLVVVDDYNLPLGTTRFRQNGSDGGHNGLKSIIATVGQDFPRLRIGIGPKPAGINTIDFVLGRFTNEEEKTLAATIDAAVAGIEVFIAQGIDKAASIANKRTAA